MCHMSTRPSLTTVLTTAPPGNGGRLPTAVDGRRRRGQEMPALARPGGRHRTGGGEFDSSPSPPARPEFFGPGVIFVSAFDDNAP